MKKLTLLSLVALGLTGCFREMPSERPPIHLNTNMDDQEKFEPYEANPFFNNGAAMRQPVDGTIARGDLITDVAMQTGKTQDGQLVAKNPVQVTSEIMERGHERYNIYCKPCHGAVGYGQGIVYLRGRTQGFVQPTSLHSDLMRDYPDGHYFDVITNGVRNMMAYRYQIPTEDRWAIVHYIRALQRSQNASMADVPQSMRDQVK